MITTGQHATKNQNYNTVTHFITVNKLIYSHWQSQ